MDQQLSFFGTPMDQTASPPIMPPPAVKIEKKTISEKKVLLSDKKISKKSDLPMEEIYKQILKGLRDFLDMTRLKRGVIGVSGGVDSSLTLKLAVDALGAENVSALIMPELGLTSQENIDHAKTLCSYLKVQFYYQPINTFLMDFKMLPWNASQLANMNAKARIRMCLLYNFANTHNALVLGTSNKSELLLGYATKFGDMACDVEVIGDLLKTDVIALADYVGLPPEISHKVPTAELSLGQTDETELGAPYEEIDKVLAKIDFGLHGCIEHGMPANLVHRVFRMFESNKHKNTLPFVIPVKK